MTPDEAMFNKHILEAGFQMGLDEGHWGIFEEDSINTTWPQVFIWIAARPKVGCPDKYYLRFDLQGYPSAAPTACPWDVENDVRLDSDKWPKGGPTISSVFNPLGWNSNALYAPCDRLAMIGHDWRQDFPDYWWQPTFKIEKYLQFIYTRLQSGDYVRG